MLDDVDLEEIPANFRHSIQRIINKRVGMRIAEEVAVLRDEIKADIADQKVQEQVHINQMVQRPGTVYDPLDKTKLLRNQHFVNGYAGPYAPGYVHPNGLGLGYGHGYANGYGHPGFGYGGYSNYGHPGAWNGNWAGDLRDPHFYSAAYRHGSPVRDKVKVKSKNWQRSSKI